MSEEFRCPPVNVTEFNVASGAAGYAVAMHCLRGENRREFSEAMVADVIRHALDHALERSDDITFATGMAGVLWANELVGAPEGTDVADQFASEVSNLIESAALETLDLGYLSGLVGLGALGMRIVHREAGARLVHVVSNALTSALDKALWGPRAWSAAGEHSLGIAHGDAGRLVWLAKAVRAGVLDRAAVSAISDVLFAFLELPRNARRSFPSHARGGTFFAKGPPDSWCHGDLGIGYALLATARIAGIEVPKEQLDFRVQTALERSSSERVKGAGLCHGEAGRRLLCSAIRSLMETSLSNAGNGSDEDMGVGWGGGLLNGNVGCRLVEALAREPSDPAWMDALLMMPMHAT